MKNVCMSTGLRKFPYIYMDTGVETKNKNEASFFISEQSDEKMIT